MLKLPNRKTRHDHVGVVDSLHLVHLWNKIYFYRYDNLTDQSKPTSSQLTKKKLYYSTYTVENIQNAMSLQSHLINVSEAFTLLMLLTLYIITVYENTHLTSL